MGVEWNLRRMMEDGFRAKARPHIPPVRGRFALHGVHDANRRRAMRSATFEPVDGSEAPPELFDAVVVEAHTSILVVTGFERVPSGTLNDIREVAQTWWLTPAAETEVSELMDLVGRLCSRLAQEGIQVKAGPPGQRWTIPGEDPDSLTPMPKGRARVFR